MAFWSAHSRSNASSLGEGSPSAKIAGVMANVLRDLGWTTVSERKQQSGQASSTLSTTPSKVLSRIAKALRSSATSLNFSEL